MPSIRTLAVAVTFAAAAVGCASTGAGAPAPEAVPASSPDPTPAAAPAPTGGADALYTADQARRGESVYERVCLECHTKVEFKERPFLFAWEGTSVAQLYTYIAENMPDDGPGSLPESNYVDALAYILEMNGYPAGEAELTADVERMRAVPFQAQGGTRP